MTLLDKIRPDADAPAVSFRRLGWAFLLAWVFCVFYMEIALGNGFPYRAFVHDALIGLVYQTLPVFTSVATIVALLLAERRFGPPSSHRRMFLAAPALCVAGTPLLYLPIENAAASLAAFGLATVAVGIGSGILWIMWGEYYARIPQEDTELLAPVSAVVAAALTLAVSAMSGWVSLAVVSLFPLASGVCLALAWKDIPPHDQAARPNRPATFWSVPRSMGRTILGILAACFFVCIAGSLFGSGFSTDGIQIALVGSIVFTVIVAAASVVGPRRVSISFFYRWMCPIIVCGFGAVVFFGVEAGGFLSYSTSIAARFAFCLLTQMHFARYVASGQATAVQSFGWGWISVHLGDMLGVLASIGGEQLMAKGAQPGQLAVVCMVSLVAITMFVLDSKRSFHAEPAAVGAGEGYAARGGAEADLVQNARLADAAQASNYCQAESQEATQSATTRGAQDAARGSGENAAQDAAGTVDAQNAAGAQDATSTAGASTTAEAPAETFEERIAALAAEGHLTPRETEVFELLAQGRSVPYIRDALVISRETAATHAKRIYAKLDVHSRQELIDLTK